MCEKAILHYLKPGNNCTVEILPGELVEIDNKSYIFKTYFPKRKLNKESGKIQISCHSNSGDVIFKMLLDYKQAKTFKKMLNACMEDFYDN